MARKTPTEAPASDGPLAALTPQREYQARRTHVFHSFESLRWFVRRNRSELIRRGAILAPAGTTLVNAPKMDQAVEDIGRERMGEPERPTRIRAGEVIEIGA